MTHAAHGRPVSAGDTGNREPSAPDAPEQVVVGLARGGLSGQQVRILAYMASGLTNGEIAEQLHLDVKTIDTHVAKIVRRLGAKNSKHAIAIAFRTRLLI